MAEGKVKAEGEAEVKAEGEAEGEAEVKAEGEAEAKAEGRRGARATRRKCHCQEAGVVQNGQWHRCHPIEKGRRWRKTEREIEEHGNRVHAAEVMVAKDNAQTATG